MILPTISLALITYAAWSRFQRAAMLEVLNSDYVRLARAKGLEPRQVLIRHALRTALIPLTTVTRARHRGDLRRRDHHRDRLPVARHGRSCCSPSLDARPQRRRWRGCWSPASFVILCNLIADLLYAVLDPRIRYA